MAEAERASRHASQRCGEGIVRYAKTAIATVVLVAVLAAAGIVALSLARGAWMVTPVLSGSMRPGFPVGGVVISQRTPLKDIAVLDVIVFQNPDQRTEQMIHRIIKLTHEPGGTIRIETKGDNNPIRDPWTVEIKTRYVYRIRYSVPLIGYVAVVYQNHRAYFVMGAGLLVLLSGAGTWVRFLRRSDAKDASRTGEEEATGAEGEAPDTLPAAVPSQVVGATPLEPVTDDGGEPGDGDTVASAGRRRTEVAARQ